MGRSFLGWEQCPDFSETNCPDQADWCWDITSQAKQTSDGSFFKSLLCGLLALLMLWARNAGTVPQALQILPATALVYRPPHTLGHPGCHFGAAPETAIGRRLRECLIQLLLLLKAEQGPGTRKRSTMIEDRLLSGCIEAPDDAANPASRIARRGGDLILSKRESEIIQMVVRGLSTAEIATTFHISSNTVQDHLKAIFDKVGVRSRRELVGQVFAQHYQPRIEAGRDLHASGWFT